MLKVYENDNLFGHDKLKNTITNYLSTNFHHAFLFHGNYGIGKATTAFQIAKHLLLRQDNLLTQEASQKKMIEENSHPDLLYINSNEKNILLEDIKKINDLLSLKPTLNKYRIIIIDNIDNMNMNANNSLLKNLEEPPTNTLFILISHDFNNILDTIKSRCISFKFNPLSDNDLRNIISNQIYDTSEQELYMDNIFLSNNSMGMLNLTINYKGMDLYLLLIDAMIDIDTNNISAIESFIKNSHNHYLYFKYLFKILFRRIFICLNGQKINFIVNKEEILIDKLKRYNIISLLHKFNQNTNIIKQHDIYNTNSFTLLINLLKL